MTRDRFILVTCILLACGYQVRAAEQAASPTAPAAATSPDLSIARSALLVITATPAADALDLHIRRVRDQTIVNSDDVTVSVDGKNEPVTRETTGSYQVLASDLRGDGERVLEIVVGHDGIREILTGKITLPQVSSAGSLFRDHKQIAWWILNIVIVLVAAIAISRRKG